MNSAELREYHRIQEVVRKALRLVEELGLSEQYSPGAFQEVLRYYLHQEG